MEICGNLWGGFMRAKVPSGDVAGDADPNASGARTLSDPLRACSACAGDYEDPERTAGEAEVEADEGEQDDSADEFPTPRT